MDATQHKRDVGWRLRVSIEAVGQRPSKIAKQFGVSPSQLGNWMRGDDYPQFYFIEQFCREYPISADWIIRGVVGSLGGAVGDALEQALRASSEALKAPEHQPPDDGGAKKKKKAKV